MGETLAELPFTGDQVGLFRVRPGRSKRTCNSRVLPPAEFVECLSGTLKIGTAIAAVSEKFQTAKLRRGFQTLGFKRCGYATARQRMSDIDIQKNRCRTTVASRFGETPAKTVPYRGSDRLSRPRPGRLEKTCIWG